MIPGSYAWAVTVAPVAWAGRGASLAKAAALLGLLALVAGPVLEKRWRDMTRLVSGWGLVLCSIVVWVVSSDAAVLDLGATRGLGGMLGWALFAFASASPAREPELTTAVVNPVRAKTNRTRADTPLLLLGVGLAVLLQVPGWQELDRERALLLRLSALAGGLGLVTTAGVLALRIGSELGKERVPRPRRRRLPVRVLAWPALAFGLLGLGAVYSAWFAR